MGELSTMLARCWICVLREEANSEFCRQTVVSFLPHKTFSQPVSVIMCRYWCALCAKFESPQEMCVCQTCKGMICKGLQCAIATSSEMSSLEKFECKSCWCDRWYAAVKDRAGDVLLGSRISQGISQNDSKYRFYSLPEIAVCCRWIEFVF